MRKLFGNSLNDGVGQDSWSGAHDTGFDISSFMGPTSSLLYSQQGQSFSSPHASTSDVQPTASDWSTASSSINYPGDNDKGSAGFGISPSTSSLDASNALQHNNGNGASDLGQLMLLDTDAGVISPFQSSTTSGSGTSTTGTSSGSAPPPTLIGTAGGFQIDLIWDASVASAPAAFQKAAMGAAYRYAQLFSNSEVVNIHVGYGEVGGSSIGSGSLASSMSTGYYETYSQVAAGLKSGTSFSSWQQSADSTLTATDPTNGGKFFVTKAEAKTLGQISGSSTSVDGYVGLSNAYNFNYTGKPMPGQYDAIGAFEHEFSEVMGRMGSVGFSFGSGVYTPLDLFRYSSSGVRDLTAGPGYFSVNSGTTNLGNFNNPLNGGDAGDWIGSLAGDSYGSGYPGMVAALSPTDIIVDSAIGYKLTPTAVAQSTFSGLA